MTLQNLTVVVVVVVVVVARKNAVTLGSNIVALDY